MQKFGNLAAKKSPQSGENWMKVKSNNKGEKLEWEEKKNYSFTETGFDLNLVYLDFFLMLSLCK